MGFLFKGFSQKGEYYFRNTIWDYIIMIGAIIVFLYSFLTIEYVEVYSIWADNTSKPEYAMKIGMQVFLAPLIALHRIVLMILGERRSPKLRILECKFKTKLIYYTLKIYFFNSFNKLTKKQKILCITLWIIAIISTLFIISKIF